MFCISLYRLLSQLMVMASTNLFDVTDPNFCQRCGAVLPLPTVSSTKVDCKRCQNSIDISSEWTILLLHLAFTNLENPHHDAI